MVNLESKLFVEKGKYYTPWNQQLAPEIGPPQKEIHLNQPSIFMGYVSFREGSTWAMKLPKKNDTSLGRC